MPMPAATDFASTQAGPYLFIAGGLVGDGITCVKTQRYNMANNVWGWAGVLTIQWRAGLAISESRLYPPGWQR